MRPPISERKLVFLIGCAQLIVQLDFTMALPLGPDLGKDLGIPISKLGLIGGSYTAAVAVVGVAGAFFLDRFDRRRALAVALTGLVVGTAACGLATGLGSLLAARVFAGMFGGIAETLAYTIVTDAIPPERRGRAIGAILSSLSVTSVLGVPAGLELARVGGWRAPFFTLAALGAAIIVAVISVLPPQGAHLSVQPTPFRELWSRPVVRIALFGATLGTVAQYMLVPNLSAYIQFNRGYPRDQLSLIYMVGGMFVFGTTRLVGWLIDRHGAPQVALFGATLFAAVLIFGFIYPVDAIPLLVVFVAFMISSGFRLIPIQVLMSRIPGPRERARFMSLDTAVDSLASATGATLGTQILSERMDGSLAGIDELAWLAIAMTFVFTALTYLIERRVRAQTLVNARPASTSTPHPLVSTTLRSADTGPGDGHGG